MRKDKLTLEQVKSRINTIVGLQYDSEAMHGAWDSLNETFIKNIAANHYSVQEIKEIAKLINELFQLAEKEEWTFWYA